MIEFKPWGKTPRLFRDIIVTEKIDGTNAAVIVHEYGEIGPDFSGENETVVQVDGRFCGVGAQSRNRLIRPGKSTDNHGFAQWVYENAEALAVTLGGGHHFGEWWGQGIARNYGLDHKRFSLFNVDRYGELVEVDGVTQIVGLDIVPALYRGPFSEEALDTVDLGLRSEGSQAAPGFGNPEGFITFHSASRQVYKTLLENDELPKGVAA